VRAEQTLRRASDYVVDHPTQVIVVCLVLTAVFAPGMARLSTEAGTSQFTDGVPEADALEAVEDEFDPRFSADEPTTQLIQTGDNVLDRRGLLIMLETTERVEQRDNLRVASSRSAASAVAQELDSEAETAAKQRAAIEDATDAEIRQAIQALGDDPGFESLVGTEFNAEAAEATASLGVLTHDPPRRRGYDSRPAAGADDRGTH
jgi:Predicted exporters of the RND superfamily